MRKEFVVKRIDASPDGAPFFALISKGLFCHPII